MSEISKLPSVSIIINNYNYGRFLRKCIESALNQSIPPHEVIIVDDGSTDNSRSVLNEYSRQVKTIYQENAGQASAMNTGFSASSGVWIWFLDADDWLTPNSIESIEDILLMNYSKVQGRLMVVDDQRGSLGLVPKYASTPFEYSPALNLLVTSELPRPPPTSGNIFSRKFLNSILPIPEKTYRICADEYLNHAGLRSQHIYHTPKTIGYYRSHGRNAYQINTFFCTNAKEISIHLDSVIRQRTLFRDQFPEEEPDVCRFPYSLTHFKTLTLVDRFLPYAKKEIGLDRPNIRLKFRMRIRVIQSRKTKLKEIFAYLMLTYAPHPLINLTGIIEIRARALLSSFSHKNV